MDPTTITVTAAIGLAVGLYLLDPNFATGADLVVSWIWAWPNRQITRIRLYVPLALQRRSFRNDHVGRLLRAVDLWRIRNNPAFHEFFDNDHPAK